MIKWTKQFQKEVKNGQWIHLKLPGKHNNVTLRSISFYSKWLSSRKLKMKKPAAGEAQEKSYSCLKLV